MNPHNSPVLKKGAARCPRFDSCNAPICPLEDWRRAQHLPGERVCLWLREAVKPGGRARIAHAATDEIAATLIDALPAIKASSSAIRHVLKAAAQSGSKLANMHAVRERGAQGAGMAPDSLAGSAATHSAGRSGDVGGDHGRR